MYKKRPKRAYKPRAKKATKTTGVSQAVKTYVKRRIHSNIENKVANINYGNSFGAINESPDMNMFPMLPYTTVWTIPQGTSVAGRIGNQIKIRKVMLNYVLRPNPYDAVFNTTCIPHEIDLYLGYTKQLPGFLPASGDLDFLYQSGATSLRPAGTLKDIVSSINTDYWHISKRWRHKLGYSSNNGTGNSATNQSFNNNDFKLNVIQKLDITKFCPKTVTFNDGTNSPQGKNLFFFYQAIRSDGLLSGSTTLPCNIEFWIDFRYEDA